MSNVGNNEFISNRWRINRDEICAKKELQSSSIDEAYKSCQQETHGAMI